MEGVSTRLEVVFRKDALQSHKSRIGREETLGPGNWFLQGAMLAGVMISWREGGEFYRTRRAA